MQSHARPSAAAVLVHEIVVIIFALGVAGAVVATVFSVFQAFNGSHHVNLTAQVLGHLRLTAGAANAEVSPEGSTVSVIVRQPPLALYFLWLFDNVVVWAIGLLGLWQFRTVARTAIEGDPFVTENIRRLRIIGGVILVYQPLGTAVHYIFGKLLLRAAGVHGARMSGSFTSWTLIIAGLSVIALAEVFAQGVRLRRDVEGTI